METARVDPQETREKMKSGEALLVCAYDDEEKCSSLHLKGAIHMPELEQKLDQMPKDQEIIFYCA